MRSSQENQRKNYKKDRKSRRMQENRRRNRHRSKYLNRGNQRRSNRPNRPNRSRNKVQPNHSYSEAAGQTERTQPTERSSYARTRDSEEFTFSILFCCCISPSRANKFLMRTFVFHAIIYTIILIMQFSNLMEVPEDEDSTGLQIFSSTGVALTYIIILVLGFALNCVSFKIAIHNTYRWALFFTSVFNLVMDLAALLLTSALIVVLIFVGVRMSKIDISEYTEEDKKTFEAYQISVYTLAGIFSLSATVYVSAIILFYKSLKAMKLMSKVSSR